MRNCRRETEKISLQRDVSESLENIVLFTPNTLESNFANRNLSQFCEKLCANPKCQLNLKISQFCVDFA